VTDERGAVGSDTLVITVNEPGNPHAPVASPTATPQSGPVPLTVKFEANASDPDGDRLTYAWDFGDGTTSKAAKVTHTYYSAATFAVSLTVSDGKDSIVRPLTIVASPINEIDVDKLDIHFKSKQGVLADVKLQSELRAGIPPSGEVIALTIDGDPVFAAPLSSFQPDKAAGMPTKYKLKAKDLFVELDFAKRRFSVVGKAVMLPNFDAANGVEVVLKIGAAAAVDNVPATDHNGDRHYKYK
jgi:PKD repeat protein